MLPDKILKYYLNLIKPLDLIITLWKINQTEVQIK